MSYRTKVQGTRYIIQLENEKGAWKLYLMIGDAKEESTKIRNNTMRNIREGIEEVLRKAGTKINDFHVEMMSKELYTKSSGDINMEEHKKTEETILQKQKMGQDMSITQEIVSEYKSALGGTKSHHTPVKEKATPSIQTGFSVKIQKSEQADPPIEHEIDPEMKSIVSEISSAVRRPEMQHIERPGITDPKTVAEAAQSLNKQYDDIETGVSAVDIDDLIKELNDTKFLLQQDLAKINKRMEKMDNIIHKISGLSSKF